MSSACAVKLFFFNPPFHPIDFGWTILCTTHTKEMRSFVLPPCVWNPYIIYLEFFFMEDLFLFPHRLIYSIIYLYQYGFISFLPHTLNFNPILLCLVTQIVAALAIGSSFTWPLCPLDITDTYLQHFLTFWH